MITVEIKAGLGNQLFQYAAARGLSLFKNVPLRLQISNYLVDNSREFRLNYFEIDETEIIDIFPAAQLHYHYNEPHFHFNPDFFSVPDTTYLIGYWQSEKYFKQIQSIIKADLRIKNCYISHLQAKAMEMQNCQSVCLHIRRGDYLAPNHLNTYGIQPVEYYEKALKVLFRLHSKIKIFLFSDDIEWVTGNFKLDYQYEFITNRVTKNEIEDFYLMQQCNHHVIANSSFSWWSAWLCGNKDKTIIAPKNWYKNIPYYDTIDLIPETWIKI